MSCVDVMYHPQPYGAPQYLPRPAAACTPAHHHLHHHHHHPHPPGQQKKLSAFKMQESLEVTLPPKQEEDEKEQPADMEYLSSRCVLLTYFQGDIGAEVDEHFSRALSQASSFSSESSTAKSKSGPHPLWREGSISNQRSSFPPSFWNSSYQPPPPQCVSGVHADFPATTSGAFPSTEPSSWPGHSLHQTVAPAPSAVSEPWHYPLASQGSPPYTHVHEVYMHHRRHHHPGSHLDPRYGSLLIPSVRAARIPAPQCDITKTDSTIATSTASAWAGAFHGTVDIVPSFGFDAAGLQHQEKSKDPPWF
ncbi:transcription cofactor vestigial-like protein 3 isoform X2 [Rhinatrema bivittatum]|uniref:transcription cofactor vestigial-like protein 3 isoform X2 n=1 Tax=Rhinatrema bivittatum TaxID=194408 RepID=UPI001127EFD6|nr:transcription cofactor vestigial-like protein 3 isoform X2 [Rhinatrema bivittatum]